MAQAPALIRRPWLLGFAISGVAASVCAAALGFMNLVSALESAPVQILEDTDRLQRALADAPITRRSNGHGPVIWAVTTGRGLARPNIAALQERGFRVRIVRTREYDERGLRVNAASLPPDEATERAWALRVASEIDDVLRANGAQLPRPLLIWRQGNGWRVAPGQIPQSREFIVADLSPSA